MQPTDPAKKLMPSRAEPAPLEYPHEARQAAPAETPAALQSAPSLGALMHSLRRSWKVVMPTAFLAAALAGGVVWMVVPAQYTSTLVLRLLSRPTLGNLDQDEVFANVQKANVSILKSFEVLSETIVKSRVAETYGIADTPQGLARRLVTHFNDGPEMLAVQLSGENPEAVAATLNALGDVLPRKMLKADVDRINGMMEQKDKSLRAVAQALSEKRIELVAAEKKAGLDKLGMMARSQEGAERNLSDAVRELGMADAELARLEGQRRSATRRVEEPLLPVVSDADLEAAAAQRPNYFQAFQDAELQRKKVMDLARLVVPERRAEMTAKPRAELERLEGTLRAIRDRVRGEIAEKSRVKVIEQEKRNLAELEDKIAAHREQRARLDREVERRRGEVEAFKNGGLRAPPEVLGLRDEVEQLEKEQARLGEQKAGLKGLFPITERLSRHTEAFVPTEKDFSRPLKYALAAGALVFGVCLIGGCLMEARSRRISDSSEIREGLGLRIIGTVPAMPASVRRKSAAALSMGGLDSRYGLTEAVDGVRTRLLHAPRVDGARIIMITSAATGEGKTTLASHLAASLARAWRKTLLIDGDLRNPNAHSQFDLPSEPGLSEALRGEMEYEDAIRPTSISRLWLLPAGKIDAHALQALTQDGLSAVFDRLKEQFDFIVIDTSPVIPVPDALVLGQQADAVILSVMRDVSRMPAVYAAQQSLEDLGIRVLGAVVSGEKTETYGKAVPYGPVPGGS
ncbi:MAG: polysaccharide biosynthesis tyrosine autokinase [Gemmataceae bacterium]